MVLDIAVATRAAADAAAAAAADRQQEIESDPFILLGP